LSGNLFSIVWTPYLINALKAPDYLVASMSVLSTLSSIAASLFWRRKGFKVLRYALAVNTPGPVMAWLLVNPLYHLPLSVYTSFTYTGANFIGTFLFARYREWFGAVRSSIFLALLGNLAQVCAAPIGVAVDGNYFLAFALILATKILSTSLAFLTIPEVAVIPEELARTYSFILYKNSVTGYRVAVDVSKETASLTLQLLALTVVIAILYAIYRILATLTLILTSFH